MKLWKSSFLATNFSRACVLCMKVAKLEVAHDLRLSLLFFIYFSICVFSCKIGGLLFACIPHNSDRYLCFLSKNDVDQGI